MIDRHNLLFKLLLSMLIIIFMLLAGCKGIDEENSIDHLSEEIESPINEDNRSRNIKDPFEEQDHEADDEVDIKQEEEEEDLEENQNHQDSLEEQPAASAHNREGISNLPVVADGDYLLAQVSKGTILKSNYQPSDLKLIPDYMYPARELYLREEALNQLEKLWRAAEADGVILHILSAYRSYDYQKGLFNSYAERHGREAANRFSALAGQSEHQLGTTVDFGGTNSDLKASFADTKHGLWLAENAYRFGFALSYPAGSENITGYIYEPWHYRYIGVDAAHEWRESGMVLQEFLETKPQNYE